MRTPAAAPRTPADSGTDTPARSAVGSRRRTSAPPRLYFVARSSWLRHQRSADQLFAVADKDVPVGIGRRRPGDFPRSERERRFQQDDAADLLVSLGSELGTNQLPLVRVEQYRIAVRSQVDARPTVSQVGHLGR